MEPTLAIVIPAYKDQFLDETLESLANQSCLNFTVYIGDDHSPWPLEDIVRKYTHRLNIIYRRFDENQGGHNLISQWDRCVKMINDEDYFCLFSDDDKMGPDNVAHFFEALKKERKYDVYHFDLQVINMEGKVIQECNPFPSLLSSDDFFQLLYTNRIDARMPEFVFRTETFWQKGGFVGFDLAYRSDNATVMVCAQEQGIYTVPETKVLWRDSGLNVSSNTDILLKRRRVLASMDFFNWIENYYRILRCKPPFTWKKRMKLIVIELLTLYPEVSRQELIKYLGNAKLLSGCFLLSLYAKVYFTFRLCKSKRES